MRSAKVILPVLALLFIIALSWWWKASFDHTEASSTPPNKTKNAAETLNPSGSFSMRAIPLQASSGPMASSDTQLARSPLQNLIDSALNPRSTAESREIAIHFAVTCVSYNALPEISEEFVASANGDRRENVNAIIYEVRQSRAQLSKFCASGQQIENLIDRLRILKLPTSGPIMRSLLRWRGDSRSQEYFQAATQILSNPEQYAVQFSLWLSKDLDLQLRTKFGLSDLQSVIVQDSIFRSFVSATTPTQPFRSLERCALQAVCPKSLALGLSEDEALKAKSIAEEVKSLIERQRWDVLVPQ